MPNISSVTKYFSTAEENSVAMTLGGSILAGASTVPVNGMTNYTDNQVVTFVVDPATPSLKQVFTGTKSGSNVINAVWTEMPTGGSNVAHSAGATVIDYVTATDWDMLTTGITKSLNQDGSLITAAVQTALNITTPATAGWVASGFAPSAVLANGNHSYTLTFAAANLTTTLSPGMRLQTTRTVAAPTQCTSLNGTTQYYSKASPAGFSFTNNFVVAAAIKPSSYALGTIGSVYNGTSGFALRMLATGQIEMSCYNAGAANFFKFTSYQSVALNKWTNNVVCQVDMTVTTNTPTTNYITIDGADVPGVATRGGTNPTAIPSMAGIALNVGAENGGTNPFPGKIAQAAFYSAKVTEATTLAAAQQGLAGTETSLISAYSFNNSINDLNANANNLTANGSAVATNADSPFGGQADGTISSTLDYAIITKTAFSTNTTLTVQVPEGCTIPTTGGVSAVSYATVGVPYGFPKQKGKWKIEFIMGAASSAIASTTTLQFPGAQLLVPLGSWQAILQLQYQATASDAHYAVSTATTSISDGRFSARNIPTASALNINKVMLSYPIDTTTATTYYIVGRIASGTITTRGIGDEADAFTTLEIENAYL